MNRSEIAESILLGHTCKTCHYGDECNPDIVSCGSWKEYNEEEKLADVKADIVGCSLI